MKKPGPAKAEDECDRRAIIAGRKPEQSLEQRHDATASSNRARLGKAGLKRWRRRSNCLPLPTGRIRILHRPVV